MNRRSLFFTQKTPRYKQGAIVMQQADKRGIKTIKHESAKAQTEDKEVLLANRRESEYSISRHSLDTSHRCSLPIKFLQ